MHGMASLRRLCHVGGHLGVDACGSGLLRPDHTILAAETLFLRKQLALYRRREVQPGRATDATRLVLVLLARSSCGTPLCIVQARHADPLARQAFRPLWRWRSLSRAAADPFGAASADTGRWRGITDLGRAAPCGRAAPEAGSSVFSRTERRIYADGDPGNTAKRHRTRWRTFVRNHVSVLLACDFLKWW